MNLGNQSSGWKVYFHPVTGHHLPDARPGMKFHNPKYDPSIPITPDNLPNRLPVGYDPDMQFSASLRVGEYYRGRSSVRIEMLQMDGRILWMSLADFWKQILPNYSAGVPLLGPWGFKKQGPSTLLVRLPL